MPTHCFFPGLQKAIIDGRVTENCLSVRVTNMGCHIQTATVPNSCTHTDMQLLILSHQSKALHIRFNWTWKMCLYVWARASHLRVLNRDLVICSGVCGRTAGGCGPPIFQRKRRNEICVRSKHHGFGQWPYFDLVQIFQLPPFRLTHRKEFRAASRMLAMVSTST